MAQTDLISPLPMRAAAPKPKMTIYYALLIVSLLAMLIACLLMYLEIRRFGGFGAVSGSVASLERSFDRPTSLLAVQPSAARALSSTAVG